MKLSPMQAAAAHRLGQDVCVVAGPGSGKTRVLAERFCWLVSEKRVPPHRILAITFTEKAATEIKDRLVREFAGDLAVREQIERAYVSTIHAFCARLLRENAIAAAIDPAFQVLDETVSAPLLREATDDVLDDLYRNEPERTRRFLRSLSVGTQRDGFVPDLAGSLIEIYETLRVSGTPVGDLDRAIAPPAAEWARVREIASEIVCEQVRTKSAEQALKHAAAREWALSVGVLGDQAAVDEALRTLCRENLNKNHLVKGSAAHRHESEIRELCKRLRSLLVIEYYAEERGLAATALARIDSLYRERKRALSGLDFSDLEEYAIRLLEGDGSLRARVRQAFDFILMDELQDTNPLQWRLMGLVRAQDNFFAVGDVNQSIYGFRHADPDLFHSYRDSLKTAGKTIDELRDNYRTRKAVLDAVNLVFGAAPGVERHTLEAASAFCGKSVPSVDAFVIRADSSEEGREIEARWVAQRIVELRGSLLLGEGRPARFGDMAILTRANQSTGELQQALDEFGIPSLVLGGLTFFETREVRDLKLLLDVLVNPRNEVSLAGFLRSPLMGCTDEDLFGYRVEHGRVFEGVRRNPPPYWGRIEELREIRNTVSPDLLLRRVVDERDFESALTSRARANVEKFLNTLRALWARMPGRLDAIVREVERTAPQAEAPPAEFADAVRLMTIHKAKGLEFPVVFLPYLDKKPSTEFPVISYSARHGLGIKWRDPATNEGLSDFIREENKRSGEPSRKGEENRLLYVGMTRAMEHLVLSWTCTSGMRESWATLIGGALQIDSSACTGEPVETPDTGVRVLVTEQAPEPVFAQARESSAQDVPVMDRVEASGLYESAVSVTDISRFVECPRRYYLTRYIKWQQGPRRIDIVDEDELPPVRDDLDASELGTQVHDLLAGRPVDSPGREAVALAECFQSSELGRAAARAKVKRHEWDFVMAVHDVVLRGQVDLWFHDGRDFVVVDYKTDRLHTPVHPADVIGYQLQVQIYAEALERATGRRPTRGVLHFLRSETVYEVDVSPLACSHALDSVRELRAAQEALDFHVRRGEQCARCDFVRGWCPNVVASGTSFDQAR
jgi:ATP-dependent exoDNAse (exonuclease V) beta subunit